MSNKHEKMFPFKYQGSVARADVGSGHAPMLTVVMKAHPSPWEGRMGTYVRRPRGARTHVQEVHRSSVTADDRNSSKGSPQWLRKLSQRKHAVAERGEQICAH